MSDVTLWTYVIATNTGGAPNYDPPHVTLALCKPKIRIGARVGDMVMAFAGRALAERSDSLAGHPDRVVWAGIVKEKLSFAQYWNDPRFAAKQPGRVARPDNIYRPVDGTVDAFEHVPNDVHPPALRPGDTDYKPRDLGGRFVLVLDPAWNLSDARAVLPDSFASLRMTMQGRRGQRRRQLDPSAASGLEQWLSAQVPPSPPALRAA